MPTNFDLAPPARIVDGLLARFMGDPSPQPNFPRELRLETMIKFRDGLQTVVRELDAEIKKLEKETRSPARRP